MMLASTNKIFPVEPELMQRQRETMRQFSTLANTYEKNLAAAAAARQFQISTAETGHELARHEPDALHARAAVILKQAQKNLQGKWRQVLAFAPASPQLRRSENARALLQTSVELAEQSGQDLRTQAGAPKFPRTVFVCAWLVLAVSLAALTPMILAQVFPPVLALALAFLLLRSQQQRVEQSYQKLRQQAEIAKQAHTACLHVLAEQHRLRLQEIEAGHEQRLAVLKSEFENATAAARAVLQKVTCEVDKFSPSWTNQIDRPFHPPATLMPIMRMGELRTRAGNGNFVTPALFPFPGLCSLLFVAPRFAQSQVTTAVQSLALRLLASTPPGRLRFIFFDAAGLGQNVAPFLRLADYDETLINHRAWTEPHHLEQQLLALTAHMENVIQKYLRNDFSTLEDYNAHAGEIAEPYRLLLVMNFPVNFSAGAAQRLLTIAQNGARCGVYAVISYDSDQPLPPGFNLEALRQNSIVFSWQQNRLVWQDQDFCSHHFEFDALPPARQLNAVIDAIGREAGAARRVEISYEQVLAKTGQTAASWQQANSRQGLRLPLGMKAAQKVQFLDLGQGTAQHLLIAGKTGAGKSNLMHVLITGLALQYHPEEVELYLIDFKKGIEFKIYAREQLPHARVIAIAGEREFGLSVLQDLAVELQRRGDLFRRHGVDNLKDFPAGTAAALPRVVLLIDEFQEFFIEDDVLAAKAAQILDRLVRQGRAFGVHVVLGSQTLAGSYSLARSTIDQMAVRLALQCSEADSRLILSEDNSAARLLVRPGEAIYNAANGRVEGNQLFQVAFLAPQEHEKHLKVVRALAQQRGAAQPERQIVFEGLAPADPEKNWALTSFLSQPPAPACGQNYSAWAGESFSLAAATKIHFRRHSGSHLLILGQNEEAALRVLAMSVLTLWAQQRLAKFYVLSGAAGENAGAYFTGLPFFLPLVLQHFPRSQAPAMIDETYRELERRLGDDATPPATAPAIFLIIHGLQRLRTLHPDESTGFTWPGTPPSPNHPAVQFFKILREGPEAGIHCLAWCDTWQNFHRRVERQAMREFEMRVAFQMSHDDSMNFVDSPDASKLGPDRTLYFNEESGNLEKFRPFALPNMEWLKKLTQKLGA